MSSFVTVPLCILSWILTFVKLKARVKGGVQKSRSTALDVWKVLLFFSITLTFLVVEFASFFNKYTLPNLSLLIYNAAFLISEYFGTTTLISGINIPPNHQIIRWVRLLLVVALILLTMIYTLFISKMPAVLYFTPKSLPEVVFRLIVYFFSMLLAAITAITQLIYLPSKEFGVIRLRAILIILCMFSVGVSLLIRVITFSSYIWPFLMSPVLTPLFYIFLITTIPLFFFLFSSNQLYTQFILITRSLESWRTFQDLDRLVLHLDPICLPMSMPAEHPNFLKFVLNSEYYLYRAVIIILDGKIMLADFMAQVSQASPEMTSAAVDEHDELLDEALRIHTALQAVDTPKDFNDIVDVYRRVSHDLFSPQKELLTQTG